MNLENFSVQINGVSTNYDHLKAFHSLEELRDKRDALYAHKQQKRSDILSGGSFLTTLYFILPYGASQFATYATGGGLGINAQSMTICSAGLGFAIGSTLMKVTREKNKENPVRELDKAVVMLSGDPKQARYKKTLRELERMGYFTRKRACDNQPPAYHRTYEP